MSQIHGVIFIFVPGHARFRRNERVDQLADSAVMEEGQAVNRADIIGAIRKAGFNKRLDRQVRIGVDAKNEGVASETYGGEK